MPRPLVSVVPYRNGWLIPFVADGSCALSQAGMVTLRRVGGNGVIRLHYFVTVSEQRL